MAAKRLFIVYNPRSSRFSNVKKDILDRQKELKGYIVGKYEIEPTDVDKNAARFAELLGDGDFVIAAGGDATGIVAANAILKSGKDATLAVLPYGNFNDFSHTLGTKTLDDALMTGPAQNYYPLEIHVDGKLFRYATCHIAIGMMAEAADVFNSSKMRKILKTANGRGITSYTSLSNWYFKNRHKKQFLPEFKLNGKLQPKKTSDYIAVNGKYIARITRNKEDYRDPRIFHSRTDKLISFPHLFNFMTRSLLLRFPGAVTIGDTIEFLAPATIKIQTEGEPKLFDNVKTIEIKKSKQCLKTITK